MNEIEIKAEKLKQIMDKFLEQFWEENLSENLSDRDSLDLFKYEDLIFEEYEEADFIENLDVSEIEIIKFIGIEYIFSFLGKALLIKKKFLFNEDYFSYSHNITYNITSLLVNYCLEKQEKDCFFRLFRIFQDKRDIIFLEKFIFIFLDKISKKDFCKIYNYWFKEKEYLKFISDIYVHKYVLWTSEYYNYIQLENKLLEIIEEPDIIDISIIFGFEAKRILENHQHPNFDEYPEVEEIKEKFDFKKLIKTTQKLIKNDKLILSLYILTNYGVWQTRGDAKLLVDAYIDIFVKLDRYDILTKYYDKFEIMDNNIEFLEQITKYFIKHKDVENAKKSLEKMEFLEPAYKYIKEAKKEIETLSLLNNLVSQDIDFEKIDTLSGEEFEKLLISQFIKLGFKAVDTPTTGDYGADIIIETETQTKIIIQCKRFKNKVNLKAVQEVIGALGHFNGDIGIVITNSSFLNSAIKLAQSNGIELWGRNELMKFLAGDISFSEIQEV